MKTRIIGVLLPALLALGCAGSSAAERSAALTAVDASVEGVAAVYRAEQEACFREDRAEPEPCVAEVRRRWASAREALMAAVQALHAALGAP